MPEGCPPEPAGRPLEAAGNDGPRWMAAARRRDATGTEPGLQADSSAHPRGLPRTAQFRCGSAKAFTSRPLPTPVGPVFRPGR